MNFVRKLNEREEHWLDSFFKTHFAEMHSKSQNGLGIHADETQFAESLKEWVLEKYPTKKKTKTTTSKKDDHIGSRVPEHQVEPEQE